jgi:hypothetical protein
MTVAEGLVNWSINEDATSWEARYQRASYSAAIKMLKS